MAQTRTDAIECVIVDDEDVDAEARLGGRRIGYVWCVRDGDRLKVSDLHVDDDFRRQGVGGRLLRLVLAAADAAGVHEVWGLVTDDDLSRWPGLTDWYARIGFTVLAARDADRRDVPGAARRIERVR